MRDEIIKELLRPRSDAETVRVGFLLLKDFSLLAFSAAVEPLRAANRLSEKVLFSWVTIHIFNKRVKSSTGLETSVIGDLNDLFNCRLFLICSGKNVEKYTDKTIISIVRKLGRNGITLGAICSERLF